MSSDPYKDPVFPWVYVSTAGGESWRGGEWRPLIVDQSGGLRIRFGNDAAIFQGGPTTSDGLGGSGHALDVRAFPYLWNGTDFDREQKNIEAANGAFTVGVASVELAAADNTRDYLMIQNLGPDDVFIVFGAAATVAGGIKIEPGGNYEPIKAARNSVNAISASAGNDVRVVTG